VGGSRLPSSSSLPALSSSAFLSASSSSALSFCWWLLGKQKMDSLQPFHVHNATKQMKVLMKVKR
jgi:hypothetical protein